MAGDKRIIFYSWQSDLKGSGNRYFIQEALENAADEMGGDSGLNVQPIIDRDTFGVAGSPHIRDAVFGKIDKAAVFVADVTPIVVLGDKQRPMPNPNVLFELGYAVKALGWSQIVLVMNTAYGIPEEVPFDLRGHKILPYNSPEQAERASEKKKLQGALRESLTTILQATPSKQPDRYPAELSMRRETESPGNTGEVHNYRIHFSLKNNGTATVTNWHFDVWIPRAVLRPHVIQAYHVAAEGTETHALFRYKPDGPPASREIHPTSSQTRSAVIQMTTQLYGSRDWDDEVITAKAYMNDQLVDEKSWPYEQWCNF